MARADAGLAARLGMAARRRCPWCSDPRAWFRGWMGNRERCQNCGLRRTRAEGQELGSLTVNLVLNLAMILIAMTVAIVATVPEVPVVGLLVVLGIVGLVAPVVAYPLSQTIWMAIDLSARPPLADELADAHLWLAARDLDGA